jgi:ubiquinone/menaquinone biosynthesis C-methylase UbiE
MTRAIAARAASVVGIDVSVEMVDRARRELADLDNVEVFVGSGHDLGAVPDASADVVYSFIVFQHIPDPEITCGYIREIGRVLRPGGWTVFHVSQLPELHRPETWRKARRWRRALQWHPNRARHVELAPEWLGSALTSAQLSAAIREAGLVLEAVVGEGTQFCLVHARRREVVGNPRAGSAVGA